MAKQLLKQRLDFSVKAKIELMDGLAISLGQKKLLKQPLDFPDEEKIETMDRLTIIQGQNIVEKTVGFFSKRKD